MGCAATANSPMRFGSTGMLSTAAAVTRHRGDRVECFFGSMHTWCPIQAPHRATCIEKYALVAGFAALGGWLVGDARLEHGALKQPQRGWLLGIAHERGRMLRVLARGLPVPGFEVVGVGCARNCAADLIDSMRWASTIVLVRHK